MSECVCGHGATAEWPDLVVGFVIALLFLRTSVGVIGRSAVELRQPA